MIIHVLVLYGKNRKAKIVGKNKKIMKTFRRKKKQIEAKKNY